MKGSILPFSALHSLCRGLPCRGAISMNVQKKAARLKEMSITDQGVAALQELSALPKMDQLAVIKELLQCAKHERARVYIENSRLVFVRLLTTPERQTGQFRLPASPARQTGQFRLPAGC